MIFYKLHGAGNDFVFFTGNKTIPGPVIQKICNRHYGIGADGVIVIKKCRHSFDFEMRYFNSDGSEASFCANGGRCAVLLASRLGYFETDKCTLKAGDGIHSAKLLKDGNIMLEMKKPEVFSSGLKFNGFKEGFYFLNTGVEHTVGFFDNIEDIDVHSAGKMIRNDPLFPKGTNVDFVRRIKKGTLSVRTYERGVEAETKACGTGITAAGWLDMMLTKDLKERKVVTREGFALKVSLEKGKLFLSGPAEFVFKGNICV